MTGEGLADGQVVWGGEGGLIDRWQRDRARDKRTTGQELPSSRELKRKQSLWAHNAAGFHPPPLKSGTNINVTHQSNLWPIHDLHWTTD